MRYELNTVDKRIPHIAEMSRNTRVERGAPKQQIAAYQRGNNPQEDTHCQKCH